MNCTKNINGKTINIVTILVFVIALSLPAIKALIAPLSENSLVEKRKLISAPKSPIDLKTLEQYPIEFDNFFNDHFGFRELMVRWHYYVKIILLGKSPGEKWLIGKKQWEFVTLNKVVDDYRGLDQYDERELGVIKQILQSRHDVLLRMGIKYLVVVAPNKHTIYPEYLPNYLNKVRTETKLDQLVKYLKNSRVNFLDLKETLLEAKREEFLYLPKDSHWNQKGAFIAYKGVMSFIIKQWYPSLSVIEDKRIAVEIKRSVRTGGLYNTLGIYDERVPLLSIVGKKAIIDIRHENFLNLFSQRYKEAYKRPFVTNNNSSSYEVAVFRDSFFTDMAPFLSESFKQVVYFYEPYNEQIILQLIYNDMKPDIIIEEVVERALWGVDL